MSAPVNRIRRGLYLDSVALMRLSRDIAALPGVGEASLMIGTDANKTILADAGLLSDQGARAGPNDLILAVRAETPDRSATALDQAEALLDGSRTVARGTAAAWNPRSLDTALDIQPNSNLALISVPGPFAAREARLALERGLNVMIFSDGVALEDEIALKRHALELGLLVMGPDCGSALIGGAPLAFANEVPTGSIGMVAASGTGLQEVSSLIARSGGGVSHAIGVGGRDLSPPVGGLTTLAAIETLGADPATAHIVLISKPPAPAVAARVLARLAECGKPVTLCLVGLAAPLDLPPNVRLARTLKETAELAMGGTLELSPITIERPAARPGGRWIRGLYSGGTLCAEAQTILLAAGLPVASNVPVPQAARVAGPDVHTLIDLGADEYTAGRPHPMIDPAARDTMLAEALCDPDTAAVLLDVVIGHGAHEDPARAIAERVPAASPPVIASVCGTEQDPQIHSAQCATLAEAGILVAPSNADAAAFAAGLIARQ